MFVYAVWLKINSANNGSQKMTSVIAPLAGVCEGFVNLRNTSNFETKKQLSKKAHPNLVTGYILIKKQTTIRRSGSAEQYWSPFCFGVYGESNICNAEHCRIGHRSCRALQNRIQIMQSMGLLHLERIAVNRNG